ncbi:hypothetical protein FJZ17_04410 [Candidatus Pacearchaeota archaeon]|nr:hypothetical protein [Candidatus Pacearchaeota archaeon]
MRECEICGRPIKTGRKYCWEHRHTAQAEALRGDKIIDDATRAFYQYKTKRNDKILYSILGIYYFILVIILSFVGFKSPAFPYVFIFGAMLGPFVAIIISHKYFGVKPRYYKTISEDILKRDPEYIEWVKGWVQSEKEEREFRKSLLK